MKNPGEFLTVEQAAFVLDISEWTIRELVKLGELPHSYLGAKRHKLRFEVSQLQAFFAVKEAGL
jgi:excisionase family DNA binding protein